MLKGKLAVIRDFILKHYKVVFPLVLVACVAITVSIALHANSNTGVDGILKESAQESSQESTEVISGSVLNTDVPLQKNDNPAVWNLICSYYNAVALGDLECIKSICDVVTDTELLRFEEMAKYIEVYPTIEVYTKAGPEEGTVMAYVYYKVTFSGLDAQYPGYQAHYICTKEDGSLYMKKGENAEEVNEYLVAISTQDDVVELNNKIEVEYGELMQNNSQAMQYLSELDAEVGKAVGEKLAQLNATPTPPEGGEVTTDPVQNPTEETPTVTPEPEPVPVATLYATANATVNVRASDSEQADRLGKLNLGTTVQIVEQGVNGWTKISFEGKDGYVKSEYLTPLENPEGLVVIGQIKADTNVNVRAAASTSADKLGRLKGGATADLLAVENGWCKIKFDGKVGYVSSDYVTQQ